MIALYIAPFFVALLIYILYCIRRYIRSLNLKFTGFLIYISAFVLFGGLFCVIMGFLLNDIFLKRLFTRIGFYWLGIMLYFNMALFVALFVRGIIRLIKKDKYDVHIARHYTVIFVVLFTAFMSIYGIINAHNLHISEYEVNIDKNSKLDELNVVMIADTHLGYNITINQVEDMVNKINDLNPDVVFIAGDIFDNNYEAIDDPERVIELFNSIKSKYGIYGVLGNHDIEEKILVGFTFSKGKNVSADQRMLVFIDRSNINLLYDEWAYIEDIAIYGRPDRQKINLGNNTRKEVSEFMKDADKQKPIIVIDHQPSDSKVMAENGVDLYLNGHTHKGQVWPGTWTIYLMWDNPYGLKKYDDMYNIVTSGVGLFGVNMRTDSIAEICNIKVKFNH